MSIFRTSDGARLYYKDWAEGPPILFSHGWPLSADAWDRQMMFLASNGFRVIAHDRRGHGRSEQPWDGNTMDRYADDLSELVEALDLKNAVLVGHSMGGGEVARYVGRHGTQRIRKVVLLGAVTPLMLKTANNAGGLPMKAFDDMRAAVLADRSEYFRQLSLAFYGFNRPGAQISEGLRESFWHQGMMCSIKGAYDCIRQFSETDFTEDLKRMTIPTLVAHGSDDQIVPFETSAKLTAQIVPRATLKVYRGAPHGLAETMPDAFNADLFAFIRG